MKIPVQGTNAYDCNDCGKLKEDIKYIKCPYESEINDVEDWVYLCGDCYDERCMAI